MVGERPAHGRHYRPENAGRGQDWPEDGPSINAGWEGFSMVIGIFKQIHKFEKITHELASELFFQIYERV